MHVIPSLYVLLSAHLSCIFDHQVKNTNSEALHYVYFLCCWFVSFKSKDSVSNVLRTPFNFFSYNSLFFQVSNPYKRLGITIVFYK